jgi:hypothetical protein
MGSNPIPASYARNRRFRGSYLPAEYIELLSLLLTVSPNLWEACHGIYI